MSEMVSGFEAETCVASVTMTGLPGIAMERSGSGVAGHSSAETQGGELTSIRSRGI